MWSIVFLGAALLVTLLGFAGLVVAATTWIVKLFAILLVVLGVSLLFSREA